MNKIFSLLCFSFTLNAFAIAMPNYDHLEQINFPQTKVYVEALENSISGQKVRCTLNGEEMKPQAIKKFFQTVSDRLDLIYKNHKEVSKLYLSDNNPAFLISSLYNNKETGKMFDELKFHLTDDAKLITHIEFQHYKMITRRVNEGSIREPRLVTKEILDLQSDIQCLVLNL